MTDARFAVLGIVLLTSIAAGGQTFAVDSEHSKVLIHVGKTGLFSFAGHEHEVIARSLDGEVIADLANLHRSSVDVTFEAKAIKVTGKGESAEDVPKVQREMEGPKVLDAARYPTIRFRSRSVTGSQRSAGTYELSVTGDISLRGKSRSTTIPLKVEFRHNSVVARGKTILKLTDFGIEPPSGGGGLVNVKDDVLVEFEIAAHSAG